MHTVRVGLSVISEGQFHVVLTLAAANLWSEDVIQLVMHGMGAININYNHFNNFRKTFCYIYTRHKSSCHDFGITCSLTLVAYMTNDYSYKHIFIKRYATIIITNITLFVIVVIQTTLKKCHETCQSH